MIGFQLVEYSVPLFVLLGLAVLGAIIGALLASTGAYLLSRSALDSIYYSVPRNMIVLGLFVLYAAGVGTSGVLSGRQSQSGLLIVLLLLTLLGEVWILLDTSLEPLVVERNLQKMWHTIYKSNKRRLRWLENYYGCCGFQNSTDLPSSTRCTEYTSLYQQYPVDGCLGYMRQDVFHTSRVALRWILLAAMVQILIIAIGYTLYNRVYRYDNTAWIIDDFGTEEDMEEPTDLESGTHMERDASNIAAAAAPMTQEENVQPVVPETQVPPQPPAVPEELLIPEVRGIEEHEQPAKKNADQEQEQDQDPLGQNQQENQQGSSNTAASEQKVQSKQLGSELSDPQPKQGNGGEPQRPPPAQAKNNNVNTYAKSTHSSTSKKNKNKPGRSRGHK